MPHRKRGPARTRAGEFVGRAARRLKERFFPTPKLPAPPPGRFQGPVPFQPARPTAPQPGLQTPVPKPDVNFTPAPPPFTPAFQTPARPPPRFEPQPRPTIAGGGGESPSILPGFESAARFDESGALQDPLSIADIGLLGATYGPAAGPGVASAGLTGLTAQQLARAERAAGINIGRNLERAAARESATAKIPKNLEDLVSALPATKEFNKAATGQVKQLTPTSPKLNTKNQRRLFDWIKSKVGLNNVRTITTTNPETGRSTTRIIEESRRLNTDSIAKAIVTIGVSFGFAKFLQQEALQQIGIAHKNAKADNDVEGMKAADEVNEQILKNAGWKHAVDLLPGIGVARAVLQDFIPAALAAHEINKKATAKAEIELQFHEAEGLFTPAEQTFAQEREQSDIEAFERRREFQEEQNRLFDERLAEQREQKLTGEEERIRRRERQFEEAQDRRELRAEQIANERERKRREDAAISPVERQRYEVAKREGYKGTFEDFKRSTLKFGLLR